MKKSGFTLIELLMTAVILAILAAVAIPNFFRSLIRTQESEVKTVAFTCQIAVEDFKADPGHGGYKPTSVAQFVTSLPMAIQSKRNPFNRAETYWSGALVDGVPAQAGRVGYLFINQTLPYTIIAAGKNNNFILTLVEGM
jgi:prepilin-type N-terminal cleavage/methylation domain-containing protein